MKKAMLVLSAALVLQLLTAAISYAAPPASDPIHVVKPGETLSSIARMYGVSIWTIAKANSIPNPNLIYAGQALYIPSGGTGWGWYKPCRCWKPWCKPCWCYKPCCVYIVQPCDNLTKIACRFCTTVWAIVQANCIKNPDLIYVGQRLIIPCN